VYNWSYSIAAQYEHRLSNDLKLVPRIEYNARGGMSWSIEGLYEQEDIHLVNAQISLERGNFKTSLWVENLFNQIYFNNFSAPTLGGGLSNIAYYAVPRRYGVRASISF
jgi:outer membrane receptor protein involved in Fe transport